MDHGLWELDRRAIQLQKSPPPQVVSKISGRHAVEPFHPFLQPTVVRVDVLDMEDALDHAFSMGGMDRPVGDPRFLGQREVLGKTVVAEDGLLVQNGDQGLFERLCRNVRKHDLRGDGAPVPCHQDRNPLPGRGALISGRGSPLPGGTVQMSLPFPGPADERLVRLHDPPKARRFLLRGTG